jgi:hypothetical protein
MCKYADFLCTFTSIKIGVCNEIAIRRGIVLSHQQSGALCDCAAIVSEHMGWVRNVVLMNVYSGFGKPRGVGILSRGGARWAGRGKCKGQYTSNLRERWTGPITARRVPSKWKKGNEENKGSKGTLCT